MARCLAHMLLALAEYNEFRKTNPTMWANLIIVLEDKCFICLIKQRILHFSSSSQLSFCAVSSFLRPVILSEQPLHPFFPTSFLALQPSHRGHGHLTQEKTSSHQPPHPFSWLGAAPQPGEAALTHHVSLPLSNHTGISLPQQLISMTLN